jgi:hypothetical protein
MRGVLPLGLLRVGEFRSLALAVVLSSVGMMGEQVVLGWLVLELTDSPLMVGVALAMRSLPLMLAGIPAGVVADRADRHRVLQFSSLVMATASAALGLLTLTGQIALWQILVLSLAGGAVRALNQAARQSYVHDIAGAGRLVEGLALIGLAMRAGTLVGSLGTGALIAWSGPGLAYLAVATGYLGGALVLRRGPAVARTVQPATESAWANLVGFVRLLGRSRVLPVLMAMTAAGEALGFSHQALLPSLARDVLRVGPEGLGVMTAARSVGGIVGLAFVTRLGQVPSQGAIFLTVLGSFGVALMLLGLTPGFLWVLAILVLANALGALCDVLSQSLLQQSVPRDARGRAGGAWVFAIGAAPIGQLQIGALASLLGVGAALGLSGLGLVMIALGGALVFPSLRRL